MHLWIVDLLKAHNSPTLQVRTIRSIKDNGKTLELDAPLKFAHYGGEEYQAEVALLSRSLVLSSSSESEKSQRGGHIHVDRGEARLRGVEAFRMGQRNVLGAYPFHFHLLGDAYQSYIQDCAVYRSFYRGFVIHGTSHTTVTDNVAFDVAGSCFYLEDGVEEHNLLDNNLAAYVHVIGQASAGGGQEGSTHYESASLRHPGDAAAAGFWISNALNTITNNAASGGWAGFSMPRLDKPVGLHRYAANSNDRQKLKCIIGIQYPPLKRQKHAFRTMLWPLLQPKFNCRLSY